MGAYLLEGGVLEPTKHILGLLGVPGGGARQENGQRGRLRVLGDVDDLLEAGHAQRHVLGGHAGKVEGVQRHLGGGLAQALGS